MSSDPKDNCVLATKGLIRGLKVPYTNQFLYNTILSHPDHPSLLCISETLEQYNIDSLAVKVDEKKLLELPMPCIVQFSNHGGEFKVLTNFSNRGAKYIDDKGTAKLLGKEEFLKRWTGVCLLAETTDISAEPGIKNRLIERKVMTFLKWGVAILFSSWLVIQMTQSFMLESDFDFLGVTYMLLKFVGLTMGVMLLWYDVDKYSPTLQSFCSGSGSKKVNCNAVLESKYAKLFNGHLSLGLLGFAYFFGTLSVMVLTNASGSSLILSSYLSLAAIPAILLSIYYQAVVIKQWCKFCILIQAVLTLEVLMVVVGDLYKGPFEFLHVILLLAMGLLPILVWKGLKPLLEEHKEINLHKRGLKKIKNNLDVFHGLLSKTRKLTTSTKGLGISFLNKGAKYNVIKVCNPYCGPCAKAHPVLDELLEKEKINLQILFTASVDKNDPMAKPVRHFMAVNELGNEEKTKKALDDWYLDDTKDYDVFAKQYPMNGELDKQNEKIGAMRKWCDTEKITHTPTIFINDHKLPKEYSVEDLKEVLESS